MSKENVICDQLCFYFFSIAFHISSMLKELHISYFVFYTHIYKTYHCT